MPLFYRGPTRTAYQTVRIASEGLFGQTLVGDAIGTVEFDATQTITSKATAAAIAVASGIVSAVSGYSSNVVEYRKRLRSGQIKPKETPTKSDPKETSPAKKDIPLSMKKKGKGKNLFPDDPHSSSSMPPPKSNSGGDEVPVVPIPKSVSKSYPDYFTIDLPYYWNETIDIEEGDQLTLNTLRLNSIYAPNEVGGRNGQPHGRDTWSSIYDYYRVLQTDVRLIFTYNMGLFGRDETDALEVVAHEYPFHVLAGYCIADDNSAIPANAVEFVEGKHTKAEPLHPLNFESIANRVASETTSTRPYRFICSGGAIAQDFHYDPKNWDNHVTGVGIEERWTPQGSHPAYNHKMMYGIVYPNNTDGWPAGSGTPNVKQKIRVRIDAYVKYTVQWREVSTTRKYEADTGV